MEKSSKSREAILAAAKHTAQAHGYGGLNFRDLAAEVGIKAASIYHYFPSKADLGAAVARRYREDTAASLEALLAKSLDPLVALRNYPGTFRTALANGNRICLCSFMAAEYDDLPAAVQDAVQVFADQNVAWLETVLQAAGALPEQAQRRARAIFAAVSGAQLMARGKADIALFDNLIGTYRALGLLAP